MKLAILLVSLMLGCHDDTSTRPAMGVDPSTGLPVVALVPASAGTTQVAVNPATGMPVVVTSIPDEVPYPEATAPNPFPAVASAPDSDCIGLIELPPGRLRNGVWAMGAVAGGAFTPMLYFNTQRAAKACAGSSGLPVRQWRSGEWR